MLPGALARAAQDEQVSRRRLEAQRPAAMFVARSSISSEEIGIQRPSLL